MYKRQLSQSEEKLPAILEAIPLLSDKIAAQLHQRDSNSASNTALRQRLHDLEQKSRKLALINAALLVISVLCVGITAARWL